VNTDIRLYVTFKGHRKRRRLRQLLGDNSTDYIIDLWLTVAQDRPEGVLSGWDDADVALAAGWEGDASVFVKALVSAGFLEQDGGVYRLHGWGEHQPWAVKAKERSQTARQNASRKWGGTDAYTTRSDRLTQARAKGTHTDAEWAAMVEFFRGVCVKCNSSGNVVRDHITPIYRGGSDAITNIQPLCKSCNSSKGPDSTDYRVLWCLQNACKMPAEWLQDACGNACRMPAPSPSPTPTPIEQSLSIQELVLGGMGETAPDGAAHTDPSGEDDDLLEMTPLGDELRQLSGWGRFTMDDRAWLETFTRDYPDTIPRDVRDMGVYWLAKAEKDKKVKHTKTQWKQRLRTWSRIKAESGGGNGHQQRVYGQPGNQPSGAFNDVG